MMKFIKITTTHTTKELDAILATMGPVEKEGVEALYRKFENEPFEIDGKVGILVAIHSNYIPELLSLYANMSINFKYEDLTKDALYGKLDTKPFKVEGEYSLIDYMLECFVDSNLDLDTVLDKINELGRESLSEKDILVLENV